MSSNEIFSTLLFNGFFNVCNCLIYFHLKGKLLITIIFNPWDNYIYRIRLNIHIYISIYQFPLTVTKMDAEVRDDAINNGKNSMENLKGNKIKQKDDSSDDTSSATIEEHDDELSIKDVILDEDSTVQTDNTSMQEVKEHTVDAKDTLVSIAAKHNTTPSL